MRLAVGAASTAAAVVLASCGPASQTGPVEGMAGLSVETTITPKRNLFLQNYGDDYEFSFHFDGPVPDFKRLTIECLILGSILRTQSIFIRVLHSEFKPSSDRRLFDSGTHRATMMSGGHTSAKCKLYKVES